MHDVYGSYVLRGTRIILFCRSAFMLLRAYGVCLPGKVLASPGNTR